MTPDSESQPSSFKVKTWPEDGELDRCVACTFESEDIKKVKRHRDNHRVGYCPNCDSYFPQKNLANHIKKCSNVVTQKCDQKQCDFSSPHKWMLERHMKEVHCKLHPCQECGKSFSSPEKLQSHMKSHCHHPRHVQAVRVGPRHPGQGEQGNRTAKHIDTLTRSVVYYSGKSYNLVPKIDEVQDETEAQLTYESVPEQEAPAVEEAPSDPVPNAVYIAEDVANLQKQLVEAREQLDAKDQIIKVS